MTEEKILSNARISTDNILQDIVDTEKEIVDMEDEKEVLMRNPSLHKVRIYFLEGDISSRKYFVKNLNEIINYRNKK